MKKSILMIGACLITLGGCGLKQPYQIQEAKQTKNSIAMDEYHLSGQSLLTLEKSEFEELDPVYYVENEVDLAKVLQYAYEHGTTTVAYQSEQAIDIDETAKLLSVINPFDLSLTQNDTTYTNAKQDVLYTSHHVTFKNLDERYAEAREEAQRRVSLLVDEHMSVNEKITAIHDHLIQNSIYDVESQAASNHTSSLFQAAGVLLDRSGVCTSYSRAFMMMAQEANIPAIYVSSEEMNHGWNYVFDGEKWRYIDVTWDDPVPDQGDVVSTKFLNISVEEFFEEGSHTLRQEEREEIEMVAESFF